MFVRKNFKKLYYEFILKLLQFKHIISTLYISLENVVHYEDLTRLTSLGDNNIGVLSVALLQGVK